MRGQVGVPLCQTPLMAASVMACPQPGTALALTTTQVWSDVTTHTYGPWTQIGALCPYDTASMSVYVSSVSASGVATAGVMSIGVGGAGAETEIAYFAVGSHSGFLFDLPVRIPKGARVAVRYQTLIAGGDSLLAVLVASPQSPLRRPSAPTVDALGVDLATSRGVSLPGGALYAEVTAATSQPYRGLVVVPSFSALVAQSDQNTNYTVGVGPAGAEVAIGVTTHITTSSEAVQTHISKPRMFIERHIPAGSRLAVKHDTGRTYQDVTLLGVRY